MEIYTEWKKLKNFEDYYFINKNGEILSVRKNRIMKVFHNSWGYYSLGVKNKERTFVKQVHRLVAETFIENIENKPFVNHINGIKTDNRVENLEWCTAKENVIHAFNTGLLKSGENHRDATLTNHKVRLIRRYFSIYPKASKGKLAIRMGISRHRFLAIINRTTWKRV